MAEDKKEYNSKEFIDQLRAINDENKISMDENDCFCSPKNFFTQ